jgi:hypothetical protein
MQLAVINNVLYNLLVVTVEQKMDITYIPTVANDVNFYGC